MEGAVRVVLPGGRWVDDGRRTSALVRPLTSTDEVSLIDEIGRHSRPVVATSILTRCVGFPEPADGETVRRLTVGDREALLWHVRRLTIGDGVAATVTCAGCDEKASIELDVAGLLHDSYPEWLPTYTETVADHTVEFRLPNGFDQEALAALVDTDPIGAVRGLVAACVVAVDGDEPTPEDLAGIGDDLSERMEALDPQAEALLDTTCPSCGAPVTASLDATAFLSEEVARRGRYVLAEVHVLASTYGWSERDLLAMTSERRKTYLQLIDEERSAKGSR